MCLGYRGHDAHRIFNGTHQVAAVDFFQGFFTTSIEANELLTAVHFPAQSPTAGSTLVEISRRHGDYATCGLACMIDAPGGTIESTALSFFGIGSVAVRVPEAEAALIGQAPSDQTFAAAAAIVSNTLTPNDDIHDTAADRRHVAGVLARCDQPDLRSRTGCKSV